MAWHITSWLQLDNWPDDFYELLGRARFDPNVDGILARIHAAHGELQPYQQHANPLIVNRARRLQLDLARAEATFVDAEKRRRFQRGILTRLSESYTAARSSGSDADFTQLCDWLASEEQVDRLMVEAVARAVLSSSFDAIDAANREAAATPFIDTSADDLEANAGVVDYDIPFASELASPATPTASLTADRQSQGKFEGDAPVALGADVDAIILRTIAVAGILLAVVLGYLVWKAAMGGDPDANPSRIPSSPTLPRQQSHVEGHSLTNQSGDWASFETAPSAALPSLGLDTHKRAWAGGIHCT